MKVLLILATFAVVTFSKKITPEMVAHWKETILPYKDVCVEETKVANEAALTMFDGRQIPNEKRLRCFCKCINEKLGFLVNGQFDNQKLINTLKISEEVGNRCIESVKNETDLCAKVYKCATCVVESYLVDTE